MSNRRELIRTLLTSPQAFASTLLVIGLDQYGADLLGWHPETIRLELAQDFGVDPLPVNMDKLLAAIDIINSDAFFQQPSRFIQYCNILSGDRFDPLEFDKADALECAWGLTEGLLLYPPEEDEELVAEDVRRYIGKVLDDDGVLNPPDVLGIALREKPFDYSTLDSEDPEMFAGQYELQTERGDEIKAELKERLTYLLRQLETLPLQNGNSRELTQRLSKGVRSG